MPKEHSIPVRVLALLLILLTAGAAAEPRRITVYAPRVNYQVDILVRDGVDYVGLTDLLEPLGRLEWRSAGGKLALVFNESASEFQDGKRQYRTAKNSKLEMPSSFLLIDGRGYVPVSALAQLLPQVANQPAEFHAASRRLFVGSTQLHFAAELRHSPSRLVLTFPVPVNPSSLIESGRVRLLFRREPVVNTGADNVTYGDSFLLSTTFAEMPGGAEFIAAVSQPATVTIGDGGRTVTIASAMPQAAPQAAPPATPIGPPTGQPQTNTSTPVLPLNQPHPVLPAPHARPFVILDAAHGGYETGEVFSPSLQEKTVNLAFARRLQKELEARGIPVVLTRVADNLVTWDQRAVSANTSHAALYVALHSSSIGHGVRVYTAMVPAAPPGQSKRSFLPWELAQSPFLDQSAMAASAITAECASEGLTARNSAAPLRPLNSVTLAAVAVELAPIGTSADELGTAEYQQKVAAAIASGIGTLRGKLEAAQ